MSWSFSFEGTRDAVKKAVAAEVERLAGLKTMSAGEVPDVRAAGAFIAAHVDALVLDVAVASDDPRKWNGCRVQASGSQQDGLANLNVHVERKHFSL